MARGSNKRKRSNVIEPVLITIDPPFSEHDMFRQSLIQLYDEQCLCDVKFDVRGHTFHAHKLVLAAANSFLGTMVTSGMSESSRDIIPLDVDPELFRSILNYIYGKPIEVPSTSIVALLSLCNSYCMMGLRDRLAIILSQHLSIDNCCSILLAGDCYNCEILLDVAKQLLYNNFVVISKTEGFLELPANVMEYILQSDEILDCDELMLFDVLVRWVEYQPQEREASCGDLLQCIRFPLMNSAYLSEVIKHHPLITQSIERLNLIFEAFEHHALVAGGRPGLIDSPRTKKRKQSCSFTRYTALQGHDDAVSAILLLGEYIITGSWDATLKIWKQETIEMNVEEETITGTTSSAATSPAAFTPTATSSKWVCIHTLDDHAGAIRSLCQCQGKLVSCSDDGTIKVWSPETWDCLRSMEGHDGATNCVIDCLGRLASGGDDGTIKLWGSTNNWMCEVTVHHTVLSNHLLQQPLQPPQQQQQHAQQQPQQAPQHLGVVDDVDEEEGGDGGVIPMRTRVGVISMAVYEDKLISGSDDATVRIWNMNSWVCERILRGHTDEVWTIKVWNHDLYTGSVDGTVRVWRKHWIVPTNNTSTNTTVASNNSSNGGSFHRTGTEDTVGSILTSTSTSSSSSTAAGHHLGSHYHHLQQQAHHHLLHSSLLSPTPNYYDWQCEATIRCDGAVYTVCCFENKIVTAGASNRISIWKPAPTPGNSSGSSSSSSSNSSSMHSENWTLYKWLDTDDDGVWCMDMDACPFPTSSSSSSSSSSNGTDKGRFVSGGCDGTIRVWQ